LKISKEIKVGLVVIVSIALLIYGINYLKGIDLFKNQREYHAIYDRVDGITPASPVLYNGLKVGQITKMELIQIEVSDSTGKKSMVYKHFLTFIIDNDDFIFSKNSVARLISSDFLTRAVEIVPLAGPDIEPGDTLMGEGQQSLTEKVDAQIAPIKKKAEELLASLDTMVTVVSSVLGDNKEDLALSIQTIKKSLNNLQNITAKIDEMVDMERGKISSILTKIDNVAGNIQKNNSSIDKAIDNIAAITDSVVNADIGTTINKVKENLESFSIILDNINNGNGSFGKLISSDSLYNAVVETNEQLNKLIQNITEHPNRYLHFSVIGRKEKGLKLDPVEEKKLKDLLNK